MRSKLVVVLIALSALCLALACSTTKGDGFGSSSGSSGTSGTSGTSADASTPDASGTSDGTTSGPVSGTIGGAPFTMKRGLAFVDTAAESTIDLIFSNVELGEGLCSLVTNNKIHPGETIIQLYGLKGTAPGTFTSTNNDIKYATIKTSCPAGEPVGETNVEKSGRVTTSTITFSSTSPLAEGTVDLAFDDGSRVTGSFSVPICAATLSETATCSP